MCLGLIWQNTSLSYLAIVNSVTLDEIIIRYFSGFDVGYRIYKKFLFLRRHWGVVDFSWSFRLSCNIFGYTMF